MDSERKHRVALPIEGMECTACAVRIERRLKRQPGVAEAVVNYATGEAVVVADKEALSVDALVEAVEQTGYGVRKKEITLELKEDAHVEEVVEWLKRQNGVLKVSVEGEREDRSRIRVAYIEGIGAPEEWMSALHKRGWLVTDKQADYQDHTTADIATEAEKAYRALLFRFWIAALFTLPVVLLAMVPGLDISGEEWIEWLLTTPVVFWSGSTFFKGAWRALKHRTADMNTLVAVGVGAAYLYSVVATLWPEWFAATGQEPAVYFEAAAVIITLILLGRVLEWRAKARTNAAIQRLLHLQPPTARVWRQGEEVEIPVEQVQVGDRVVIRPRWVHRGGNFFGR